MRIAIIGLGYVGLANVAFLAESHRHELVAFDTDESKIALLKKGTFPFSENGIAAILKKEAKRILFTTKEQELTGAEAYFFCVGTPAQDDGQADLHYLENALAMVGRVAQKGYLIIRSTVPVGTAKRIQDDYSGFRVISLPEFLSEGSALEDESNPFRIVVGARQEEDFLFIRNLRKNDLNRGVPFHEMSNESAELCKYASNLFLAMKISYINEMARFAETLGADIVDVADAMGADPRIGHAMLKAGVGYGGSCFPKDGQALLAQAGASGTSLLLSEATSAINRTQPLYFLKKIEKYYPAMKGVRIALFGLAYKARTGDIRSAVSLSLTPHLLANGVQLSAYDPSPEARANYQKLFPGVKVVASLAEAVAGADALLLLSEESEFASLDEAFLCSTMKGRVIFDGRNLYSVHHFRYFDYISVGRANGTRITEIKP